MSYRRITELATVSIIGGIVPWAVASLRVENTVSLDQPAAASTQPGKDARRLHGRFTGDVKVVLYVRDVRRSAAFFRDALGFTFHHYHDYKTGGSVKEWTRDDPPIYAEMSFAGRRFGLHLPQSDEDEGCVGHAKTYFRVKDLEAHHRRAEAWGAKPSTVSRKPWMDMFRVTDPDGHRLYFAFTEDETHGNPWAGE